MDRIQEKWIASFIRTFEACRVQPGELVAILAETDSRPILVELAELALLRMQAKPFRVVVPTPPVDAPVPIRSTGHSVAIQEHPAVIAALKACTFVVDITVEGLLHATERGPILSGGTRVLMVSNERPEVLERLATDTALKQKVQKGVAMAKGAEKMRVTSAAGTNLTVDMVGASIGGGWGFADEPGLMAHWPGGLCAFYGREGAVNGVVVMDTGDINLTFKRYLESPIRLTIERDFIVDIDGKGLDAALMRSYFEAWNDRNAYAVAHLGWGMNTAARWDALTMFDRNDINGTEQRAFAGNFLFSTGSNRFANRYTLGHFDLPLRNCTVALDGRTIVEAGRLCAELS
ncbi:peptidase M29 [Ramlibacter sp.]|uniref:peptidase M29 n=1 Tax=Ramlibacter sp. TaxID=1917967 RepID=UPI003D14779B